jgi:hypothetical protein
MGQVIENENFLTKKGKQNNSLYIQNIGNGGLRIEPWIVEIV